MKVVYKKYIYVNNIFLNYSNYSDYSRYSGLAETFVYKTKKISKLEIENFDLRFQIFSQLFWEDVVKLE